MANQSSITIVSVGVISFVTGYYLHQFLAPSKTKNLKPRNVHIPLPSTSSSSEMTDNTTDSEYDDEEEEEEDDGLDINSTSLNEIPGEVRMTLIVRQDLKMGKGKAAAQCSHAALALYKKITNANLESYNPEMVRRWEYGNGTAKITLQVPNQEEMDLLYAKAISLGINSYIVHDAGRTQIAAGSATVLGLGPAPKRILDEVTGDLKLY
ncbi:Peptidyl-tRNA hydrolase 2 [Candida tropicalis]